ncbi:MAG: hypothetical protein R3Y11_06630 [Pseudomonadota bacterium]
MDYLELFSNHLFEVMKIRGISKGELSEKTGVSLAVFTSLSKKSSSPTLKTMQILSEGIGIPLPIMLQSSDSEAWKAVISVFMLTNAGRFGDIPTGYGWLGQCGLLPTNKLSLVKEWLQETEAMLQEDN